MSKQRSHGEPSQRQLRVSEVLRAGLANIFLRGEIEDPDLEGAAITVSEVQVSPDLRAATAFVMPLGGVEQQKVLDALERNQRFVRGALAALVSLKYMPALTFKLDDSFDKSRHVDELLRSPKVARDLD